MKIRKGDTVTVISGNDKGKHGKVLAVLSSRESIVVEHLNMKKRHVRPRAQGQKGELVQVAAPIRVSRVMILCTKCSKPTRVGYVFDAAGKKQRVCKRCGVGI